MIPEDAIELEIRPIRFNERYIHLVYIDIEHINKGKAKSRFRSELTPHDVLWFIFQLNDLNKEPDSMNGTYFYYSLNLFNHDGKLYRMIFCHDYHCKWLGIITLYRIKGTHEKNQI